MSAQSLSQKWLRYNGLRLTAKSLHHGWPAKCRHKCRWRCRPKVRLAVRTIEQRRSALNASARAAAVAAAPSGPPRLEVGRMTGQDITEWIRSRQHPTSHTSQATKQPRNLHVCCEELRRKAQSQSRRRPCIDSETEQLVKKLIGSLPAAASATNHPEVNCQPAPTNTPSAGNQILSANQK